MRVRTTAAVTLAMVAGVGIGAAVAPVAEGQSKVRAKGEPSIVKVEPSSTMQVFRGGSRIGVSVRINPFDAADWIADRFGWQPETPELPLRGWRP